MARCHTTKPADRCARRQFSVDSQLQAQATELARLTSLSFVRVGNEGRFWFLFSESGREECSSGRNDAPDLRVLGAKLRLHQVFWSQNLAFQSQNATMRPDFSSPDLTLYEQPHFCLFADTLSQTLTWRHGDTPTPSLSPSHTHTLFLFQVRSGPSLRFF